MKKDINILLIDDHPSILEAYEIALKSIGCNRSRFNFKIQKASDCDSAFAKVKKSLNRNKIDAIILDISFNKTIKSEFIDGEDLGIKIKQLLPDVKIIVNTSHNSNYRMNAIIRNLNPLGFLVKGDVTAKVLQTAILTICKGKPYYSETVLQLLQKRNNSEYVLDKIDRQILYELSIGTRIKTLPTIIDLSLSGIEKRRYHLKEILNIHSSGNRELIQKAKEMGFI